jgi:hypothetical protein
MPDPNPLVERFVGFFLKESFWAGEKPDYSRFGEQYWVHSQYSALMEERMIVRTSGDKTVVICRDGMMMYSDPGLFESNDGDVYPRIERYTSILNALLVTMVSQITEKTGVLYHDYFEITHLDVIGVSKWQNGTGASGIPNKSATNTQFQKRLLSSIPSGYTNSIDLYIDSPPRPIIAINVLEEGIDKFFEVVSNDENMKLASRTNKALSEFVSTSFSDSIIVAWTQVEIYLYEKMQTYAKSNQARFNADRRKRLKKDVTASETIEILEVGGQLSIDEYKDINKIRKIRNGIIHEGKVASFEDACAAIKLLENIINEKTSQNIKLALGIRMSLF